MKAQFWGQNHPSNIIRSGIEKTQLVRQSKWTQSIAKDKIYLT
jgi:hypothetical protein